MRHIPYRLRYPYMLMAPENQETVGNQQGLHSIAEKQV